MSCRTLVKGKECESDTWNPCVARIDSGREWISSGRRRTKAKKRKGRVCGERGEETIIGEKKKEKQGEEKKGKEEEKRRKRRKKERKRGKGKTKRKECCAVSRFGRRKTRNPAIRGRFPPTLVYFTPKGRVGAYDFAPLWGELFHCVVFFWLWDSHGSNI